MYNFFKYLKTVLKILINIIILLVFTATLSAIFSKYISIFDASAAFCTQYFVIGILSLIHFFMCGSKEKDKLAIIVLTIVINFFQVIPNINCPNPKNETFIKIALANVLRENTNYEKTINELLLQNADILVIEELNYEWQEQLNNIKKDYPFFHEVPDNDCFGIAIYSKIPIKQVKTVRRGDKNKPIINAIFNYKNKEFEVIAMHNTPPINYFHFQNAQTVFKQTAEYITENARETIVIGDLNTTFFSYNYKNFVKTAKLKSTGTIFKPTWAAMVSRPFRISIDHILITSGFGVKKFEIGNDIGSDHFPVYAEIYLSK